MDDIIYDVILDLKMRDMISTNYRLCQGDHGHTVFKIRIFDGSKEIENTNDAKIVFFKADGNIVTGNLQKDRFGYLYRFIGNELECPGAVIADVKIKDSSSRTSTSRFCFECVTDTENGDMIDSGSYITELEKLRQEAQGVVDKINKILEEGNFKGDKGDTGKAATIQVGAVESGNTASVENVGTESEAIFNFVLPQGEQGPPGGIDYIEEAVVKYEVPEEYTPPETGLKIGSWFGRVTRGLANAFSDINKLNSNMFAKRPIETLVSHISVSEGMTIPLDITQYTFLSGQITLVNITNVYFSIPVIEGYNSSFSSAYPDDPGYTISVTISVEKDGLKIVQLLCSKNFQDIGWALRMHGIK